LESLVCIDTSQIYATGMGTGGGMMHLLACDKELSTKFAAFAAVGGAFGRAKEGEGIWGTCEPGRKKIPIAEIHGMDDRIYPYYLKEGENGKIRTIPPHWIEDWAERNECGEPIRDPKVSTDDEFTFVTKLDNGYMTETIESGGSAIRIARKCFTRVPDDEKGPMLAKESKEAEKQSEEAKQTVPTGALTNAEISVLHYQIKFFGHGWPRQQLLRQKELVFRNKLINPPKETFFDATKVIFDFFRGHRLPEKFAIRAEVIEEDPTEQATSKIQVSDAEKVNIPEGESPMEEKLRKFQEAQERIQAAGEEAPVAEKKKRKKKKKAKAEEMTDVKDEL
jgi:poly(3-hydroxybutyrate) depolymerase